MLLLQVERLLEVYVFVTGNLPLCFVFFYYITIMNIASSGTSSYYSILISYFSNFIIQILLRKVRKYFRVLHYNCVKFYMFLNDQNIFLTLYNICCSIISLPDYLPKLNLMWIRLYFYYIENCEYYKCVYNQKYECVELEIFKAMCESKLLEKYF